MRFNHFALHGAVLAVAMAAAGAAHADNAATGVWIDHTGRGAVEITECNGKLCGHVAWVEDAKNSDQCGKQIIGNVKSVGKNKWDNGWIFDPDRGSKYDVELTAIGADKLKVVGYAGTKWLSETYTWKRAPADLQKCNGSVRAAATSPAPAAVAAAGHRQDQQARRGCEVRRRRDQARRGEVRRRQIRTAASQSRKRPRPTPSPTKRRAPIGDRQGRRRGHVRRAEGQQEECRQDARPHHG